MLTCSDGGGGDDGGLINPSALIAKSADLDTSAITGAADGIRAMGTAVDNRTDQIKATWSTKLPSCYHAPEQASVYALMTGPATASEDLKTTFNTMAGYLDTYADELERIKPTLADFETRAQEFRNDVIGGVWVDATEADDANLGTYAVAGWNWATGQDQDRKLVPWYEDGDTVEKNKNFVDEVAGIYAEISTAATTCATDINGLTSLPADSKEIPPIPEEAFNNPESPMPWGKARDEDRNCPESVGHGAYQFGKGMVEGVGSLISYNPESGDWGDWGHAGQAWMGTGNVLLSLAMVGPATIAASALKASGVDNPVVNWLDERNQVASTVVTGLVGIDLQADDPFHKWKEDGWATGTESLLNVGTLFIPGAGEVGAGLKAAGMGSRIARISGAVADFAVPGGSWLVKGGTHTIPLLKNVIKFGDEVPVNLLDDVARAGGKAPTFNPGAPIEFMDDLGKDVGKTTDKSVSGDMFGNGPDPDPARPVTNSGSQYSAPSTHAAEPVTTHPDANPGGGRNDSPSETGSGTRPETSTHPETGSDPAATTTHPETATEPTATTTHPETATHPETGSDSAATTTHPDASTTHPETATNPETGTHLDGSHSAAADINGHHSEPTTQVDADAPGPVTHDTDPETHSEHTHPAEAPDGGPTSDRHGREYSFDEDGRRHLKGDPENTFRDVKGQLRDKHTWITDTNRPAHDNMPVEKAQLGHPEDFTVSDAERGAYDRHVAARDAAGESAQQAHQRLEHLVQSTGLKRDVLKGSTKDVMQSITEQFTQGRITARERQSLLKALAHDRVASTMFKDVSERLGDKAAASVARMRGDISLVRSGGAGSGHFDQITLGEHPPTLKFYEAKGGNAGVGDGRVVDGVRYQQGTSGYLNDVLKSDSKLAASVKQFIEANPDSPVSQALKDGTITVEYDLVQGLPNGKIKVTPFVIDPRVITLPTFK